MDFNVIYDAFGKVTSRSFAWKSFKYRKLSAYTQGCTSITWPWITNLNKAARIKALNTFPVLKKIVYSMVNVTMVKCTAFVVNENETIHLYEIFLLLYFNNIILDQRDFHTNSFIFWKNIKYLKYLNIDRWNIVLRSALVILWNINWYIGRLILWVFRNFILT